MPEKPSAQKYNDAKYDLLKFFLSLLVLAIHATLYPMVLYPWLRIAVPLFFIMSSYFVFSKLSGTPADAQKVVLTAFIKRNVKLYVCWFVILLPITIYIRRTVFFSHGFFVNTVTILKHVLFGSTFVASWFISATIIGVCMIYFLSKWLRNNYLLFAISFLAFCAVTLASSYSDMIADTWMASAMNRYIGVFGDFVCSYPASLFWVFMGKLFAERKIRFTSVSVLILLTLCSGVALFAEWKYVISLSGSYNNDSYFMLAPLCVLLFIGFEKIKPLYWKPSVCFKRASTIIYVAHGSLLPVVSKLTALVFRVNIPLLSFFITLIGCLAIYIVIEIAMKLIRNQRIRNMLKMLY